MMVNDTDSVLQSMCGILRENVIERLLVIVQYMVELLLSLSTRVQTMCKTYCLKMLKFVI